MRKIVFLLTWFACEVQGDSVQESSGDVQRDAHSSSQQLRDVDDASSQLIGQARGNGVRIPMQELAKRLPASKFMAVRPPVIANLPQLTPHHPHRPSSTQYAHQLADAGERIGHYTPLITQAQPGTSSSQGKIKELSQGSTKSVLTVIDDGVVASVVLALSTGLAAAVSIIVIRKWFACLQEISTTRLSSSQLADMPRRAGLVTMSVDIARGLAPDDAQTKGLRQVAVENGEVLPQAYFAELNYDESNVPWDLLGRPQPAVRTAAQDGAFGVKGTVILDCGCGAGDNTNWLAARGYEVLGFDISPSAIATAQKRSESAEMAGAIENACGTVEFVAASATDLGSAERVRERARQLGGFSVILDSALLHCLDDTAQELYLNGLLLLARPGGKLFVGCFSDANPDPWSNPRRMSEERLRFLFSEKRGWRLVTLEEAWWERPAYRTSSKGGGWVMAWWCCAERCHDGTDAQFETLS